MIPLEILKINDNLRKGYHIFCRVHIKNKQFRMMVDTGASMTIFDIKKYKQISDKDIENNDQIIMSVGDLHISSKYILIDEIKIGDILIENYKTILIDLSNINNFLKKNKLYSIDGIIGGDILFNYNAVIDYKKREMSLY